MRAPEETRNHASACAACRSSLDEYVDLELAGQAIDLRMPAIALHSEACEDCQAAYFEEFRAQGLAKPLSELQQLGHRPWATPVLDKILSAPVSTPPTPAPGWVAQRLAQGQAWLDPLTRRLRRVEVNLGQILAAPGLRSAPALAGLMAPSAPDAAQAASTGRFALDEADFGLELAVAPQPSPPGAVLCQLEVLVSLHDRFGDYSGVAVTLLWGAQTMTETTDDQGRVVFGNLPCGDVAMLGLAVTLPE